MTFEAREVEQALVNFEWTTPYTHYKYGYDEHRRYTQVKDDDGNPIIESQGEYDTEFEFAIAEDSVGHVYAVLGGVKVVDSDAGCEGHGEDIYIVFETLATGQFFRINGRYSSYGDGSQYDGDMYEVWPHEETIVVYGARKA